MDTYCFNVIVREMGGKPYHLKGRERARMRVRIRDGFKCQTCGKIRTIRMASKEKKKLFDVHHLDGECGKNSRGYDSTGDLSKLVTLCHKCHFVHHEFSVEWKGRIIKEREMIRAAKRGERVAYKSLALDRYFRLKKLRDSGLTLQNIADMQKPTITRERVRQILLVN